MEVAAKAPSSAEGNAEWFDERGDGGTMVTLGLVLAASEVLPSGSVVVILGTRVLVLGVTPKFVSRDEGTSDVLIDRLREEFVTSKEERSRLLGEEVFFTIFEKKLGAMVDLECKRGLYGRI
jgi:hypothetical protein